jgi:hypothetical protein
MYVHLYMYLYNIVCMCVCVYVHAYVLGGIVDHFLRGLLDDLRLIRLTLLQYRLHEIIIKDER